MSEAPAMLRLVSPDGRLAAHVSPGHGAELSGLEWRGRELLYRGRDFAPASGWTGRAPVLWPAIGRSFAPGPAPTAESFRQAALGWVRDGIEYPMPMHGFARSLPWAVERRTATTLRLVLSDSEATRAFYPFGFRLTLDYGLDDGLLRLDHRVEAAATNTGPMPFVLGNHATFALPLRSAGQAGEATISSNASRRMTLDESGRPTGRMIELAEVFTATPVTVIETFDVIALAARTGHPWARIDHVGGPSITVSHRGAMPPQPALEFLTLWGDPATGYLAMEPWLGKPNALASGDGLCRLAPGSSQGWAMSISIRPARD